MEPSLAPKKHRDLGWILWLRGWLILLREFLFQRISASHLQNSHPLHPVTDLVCIVTGTTSGIGSEIARQLACAGAHVVMAVRNPAAAHELIHKWQSESCDDNTLLNIEVMELDLLSLHSVVKFAKSWNACSLPLHVLINNAGIFTMGEAQSFSKDGYETHMQVNHLGPALLSLMLFPSLIRGSPSRIINVNSTMHHVGFVNPEEMGANSLKGKYTTRSAYSASKLAQVMFFSVLHKRLPSESGINVICTSPGIVHTNLPRGLPNSLQLGYRLIPYFIFNAQEGARSTLFAATDPQVPEYCEFLRSKDWPVCAFISQDCRPTNPSEEAHDTNTSQEVWERTLDLIGLPSDALESLLDGKEVNCRFVDS